MPSRYYGKYSGVVKDNQDQEKLGRLQVSVPTIFPPDELVTARAALPYGFFFVPENEAKVWIEFEGGDTGLPLWTGIQYVPGEWAPEAEADPPTKRVIKTASGHLIVFDDTEGEEKIEITDGVNGHVVTLDASGILVTDGVNGHALTLDSSGVAIADGVSSHAISLTSSGVTVEAASGAKVELTAASTTVDSGQGAKVELTAGMSSVDAGGGILQVKGSMIMLSSSAAAPVLRFGIDQGIGNLGAPVPLVMGTGNPTVLA